MALRYDDYDLRFYGNGIEGDLQVDPVTGDLALTEQWECPRQDMTNRIRTQTGDWSTHPDIGGDLELLEGEPNTRATADQGAAQILRTLTFDGRFSPADLTIRPVPTSIDQIDYYVFLDAGADQPLVVKQTSQL
ncbi:hypothetical protein [Alicyclobacillus shizuokensis]|uniref:hypothetical protein n=1 Tax=Alicyclobacillus shizuokensis TaxID=392014 RepID=UPI000830BDB5|nr:hypothetical protein [Alicyclobacillus shizuokensis]